MSRGGGERAIGRVLKCREEELAERNLSPQDHDTSRGGKGVNGVWWVGRGGGKVVDAGWILGGVTKAVKES